MVPATGTTVTHPIAGACVAAHALSPPPTHNNQSYDVWNEPLHSRTFLDRCGLWNDTFRDAFFWANEADPTAQLCINE